MAKAARGYSYCEYIICLPHTIVCFIVTTHYYAATTPPRLLLSLPRSFVIVIVMEIHFNTRKVYYAISAHRRSRHHVAVAMSFHTTGHNTGAIAIGANTSHDRLRHYTHCEGIGDIPYWLAVFIVGSRSLMLLPPHASNSILVLMVIITRHTRLRSLLVWSIAILHITITSTPLLAGCFRHCAHTISIMKSGAYIGIEKGIGNVIFHNITYYTRHTYYEGKNYYRTRHYARL